MSRPAALLDLMRAEATGNPAGPGDRAEAERVAVAEVVAWQRAAGLDVISDGEQSKPGFFAYIGERLSGFEPRPDRDPLAGFRAEIDAVADALHEEYAAIVAAGFTLQVDDPFLTDVFSYHPGTTQEKLEKARLYVNAINRGLRGISRERIRLHTCYGMNEGPRVHDAELADMAETLFTIEAGAFSFEAAIVRAKFEALAEGARRATARLWA